MGRPSTTVIISEATLVTYNHVCHAGACPRTGQVQVIPCTMRLPRQQEAAAADTLGTADHLQQNLGRQLVAAAGQGP
jgi:hypothetical protein